MTAQPMLDVSSDICYPVGAQELVDRIRLACSERLAAHRARTVWMLIALSRHLDDKVRAAVARNPATPPNIATALTLDAAEHVQCAASWYPFLAPAVLDQLGSSMNAGIRVGVASNPSTPAHRLDMLARDTNADVRRNAARNPSTSPETLERLTGISGSTSFMATALAVNPSTPPGSLAELATSSQAAVCRCVAYNPSTSAETRATLAVDPDVTVRSVAIDPSKYDPIMPAFEPRCSLSDALRHPRVVDHVTQLLATIVVDAHTIETIQALAPRWAGSLDSLLAGAAGACGRT